MFISIAGIIGAGKTTLSDSLSEEFNLPSYHEPVSDNVYLEDFYKDMKRYAFPMQIFLLNKRFVQHQQIIWQDQGGVQDRTIYEDTIFARMLNKGGYISDMDYATYLDLFKNMSNSMRKPTLIVWLAVSPQEALDRIKTRGRDCEKNITLEYLISLHQEYEFFMQSISKTTPVIKVNWEEKHKDVTVLAKELKKEWEKISSINTI